MITYQQYQDMKRRTRIDAAIPSSYPSRSRSFGHTATAKSVVDYLRTYKEADQLGLEFDWEWDDMGTRDYIDADDYCCNEGRREKAGYTDGRRYTRTARRKYGVRGKDEAGQRYRNHNGHGHEWSGVVVKDVDGNVLASCWGFMDIEDYDNQYYRIEAECNELSQAIYEYKKQQNELASHALDIVTLVSA